MASIPIELDKMMSLDNWVAYEIRHNPDNEAKPKKIPINPHTGDEAKSNDASTWGTISNANDRLTRILRRQDKNILGCGIGFMFGVPGKPSGIAGIDIDHCFNDDGTLKDYAAEIVKIMNSYTEYSPSNTGLHILFTLTKSLHELDSSFNTGKKNTKLGIEIYDSGRYFTVTGNEYGGQIKPLNERTEQARQVIAKYFTQQAPAKKQEAQTQITYNRPDESDSELWAKLFNMPNGARVKKLYEGDISDYDNDDSSADMALCVDLAYITNNNPERIERMFYQTVLANRDKWRNRPDYRLRTIENAIEQNRKNEQERKAKQSSTQKQTANQSQQDLESKPIEFQSDADYLDAAFECDIKNFQNYSGRKTGFANLDGKLILYPCLCTFGAISSLGKTTFSLQLADNLASMGEHVLYFAFEQTRFELVSKSLARLCQPEDSLISSYPSAIDIRNGRITTPKLREAMQKFKAISQHKQIIECDFTMSVSKVVETVEDYIKQTGVKPVIFVDYLQVISSDNSKLTNTKDIVDDNIKALKLLQMRHELLMFVVSSINRENYLTTIDFQSFKESGSIEFTCDIVIGMQLAIMNTNLFESDAKTTIKRKAVKSAKKETPRHIELCILKNRYGVSSESFFFQYYPKFDLFIPEDKASAISAVKSLVETELAKDKKQAK